MLHAPFGLTQGADEVPVTPEPKSPLTKIQLPKKLLCQADQTAGLHDYVGPPQEYEASTFFESKFQLRINNVLTKHLTTAAESDLYLTMFPRNDTPVELSCRQVQGQNRQLGYSCTNTPPSEILLISPSTLRFTRASIGGWTFSTPAESGATLSQSEPPEESIGSDESLFVEYGTCSKP